MKLNEKSVFFLGLACGIALTMLVYSYIL